ncbi:putative c-type cytochrome biogenesis protein (chromatophore) [Paulinella micropora]|uniref:Cytochrome c biogenesis protein CcsB n=1 Tax=Paulinella micropora TaxID=1928728 RepID=A0A1L5YBB8_9EUKA|nr:putative c-type cytochrome biogenesis protein [Paulinella micropora]AQX44748.1 putative c-type cytochrome biogenesis protein [Paulinella micropora]BBL85960.1 putative c-type cytochrome biogenesis protein [Paulinella micropora]
MKDISQWISNLRVAIFLLLVIAITSGLGTALPQQESPQSYQQSYESSPWLGLFSGDSILQLQLDHVYSSDWFLALLAWLGVALILCSWRRQWPALQATLRWVDYQHPRQLSKLALAETMISNDPHGSLQRLGELLREQGWQVRIIEKRLAARRGIAGRVGPLLVHTGLIMIMIGAVWGVLGGHRLERFLAPGREIELLNSHGKSQVNIALESFQIDRDPVGRTEQYRSLLYLRDTIQDNKIRPSDLAKGVRYEISVNHPLRYGGMTVYQADWALAAITVQLGNSPFLQLPLEEFPQLGNQVWGVVLPTNPDGSDPILLALSSEKGPVEIFGPDGASLGSVIPGGESININGLKIRVRSILPASGLLFKRDPGVPLVYTGFAIALLGGSLSLVATRQIWAIAELAGQRIHIGGLSNRGFTAFACELPTFISAIQQS